jgi:transcription elongation factor S-II
MEVITDYRKIAYDKIYGILKNKKKSKLIEDSIYEYTVHTSTKRSYNISMTDLNFRNCYKNKLMSLYLNLKKDSYVENGSLFKLVKSGKFDIKKLAFKNPCELCPEKWEDVLNRTKAKKELEYSKYTGFVTDRFKCSKCKQNKCSYTKLQMKSIDEPMTTLVKCLNCGYNWKFT